VPFLNNGAPLPQSIGLLSYRVHYYYSRDKLLYTLDLCYWVHICGLFTLWLNDGEVCPCIYMYIYI